MDRGTAGRLSAADERPAPSVRPPSALREWPLVAAMLTLAWLPPLAAAVALPVLLARAGNPTAALLPVVVTLLSVLAAVVARRRIPGRAVRPRDEPELAALVQDVAERLGFRAPLLVRIVPDVQASLSRATVSGIRAYVLVLGLPVLRTLTADQLAAVVAHELAHVRHVGHRRTSWLLMARHALTAELKPRFRPTAPVAAPLLRATQSRAWRTETDSDADAARLLGKATTAAALERSIRLNSVYEGLGLRWWSVLAQHDGSYPQDFYDALDTAVRDPHVDRSAARAVAEHDALDPYATAGHPPLADRLAALPDADAVTAYRDEPLPLRTGPALEQWCVGQLAEQGRARRGRRDRHTAPRPTRLLALPPDRLRQLLEDKGPSPLQRATEQDSPARALHSALDAIADGTWPRLARRIERGIRRAPRPVRPAYSRTVLTGAMVLALATVLRDAGWTHPSRWRTSVLTSPDGTVLDLSELLTAAVENGDTAPVRALLTPEVAA
ncbi:M48 family metalloprotease [Streptomyces sp. S3(2020)]|uniref:M48 family metallopeptidase n=1 Tax=Streptomyces sp. S3(2020) TaxID=2732044 RepID=UPI0014894F8D|nr:M48 family metallopeptidase [Streptomyces sp. S3(2020)]NNN36256.1 M48 family metalloprotease [Streptomyces sp. S3(2020)]